MMKTAYKEVKAASLLVALVTLTLVLGACTKSRDAEVADEATNEQLIAIKELNKGGQLIVGSDAQTLDATLQAKPLAVNEKPVFRSTEISAPSKIAGLLKDRPVFGKPGETAALKFDLSSIKYLEVLKRLDNPSEVPVLYRNLIRTENGIQYLPIYAIPVVTLGKLVGIKSDNGERSYKQELRETKLAEATHVRLDLRPEMVKNVDIDLDTDSDLLRRELFIGSQLDKQLTTVGQLGSLLQIRFSLPADQKVYTSVALTDDSASPKATINVYSIVSKELFAKDPALLEKMKTPNKDLMLCPADIQKASGLGEQCVLRLDRAVEATSQLAIQKRGENGFRTPTLSLQDVAASKSLELLRVKKDTSEGVVGIDTWKNLAYTVRVADIKNKEFLFRRTFEDSASTISAFAPGASGNMDIIRFEMEVDRLVIRRVETLNALDEKASKIDREELLSVPATYLKTTDENGRVLATPRPTTLADADLISLDWTKNTLETYNSPIGMFDAGQCFQAVGNQTVVGMDNRLSKDGVLNFSLDGSYSFWPDCMSYFQLHDYWYGFKTQNNFNLLERVSFKVYDKSHDKMVNQDLPFRAQTLLNVGLFTMGKLTPDQFGNIGRDSNEKAFPVIQDFTNGKTMTYYLGGLPSKEPWRTIFINTTKQVIADWNDALRASFAGTSLARSSDYIILKIDGIDSTPGHLGDLDRNYIWNFDKNLDSSVLGMSQTAPNPRTGYSEANNVLMYSGNLLSYIGGEKENARIQLAYENMRAEMTKKYEAEFQVEMQKAAEKARQATLANGGQAVQGAGPEQVVANGTTTPATAGQQLVRRWSEMAKPLMAPKTPAWTKNPATMSALAKKLSKIPTANVNMNARKTALLNDETFMPEGAEEKVYLQKMVLQAMQLNPNSDDMMSSALTAAEVLKAYGKRLSDVERDALTVQTRRLALAADFKKNFSKMPGCMMTAEGIPLLDNKIIATAPLEEIFSNFYASTLSHEIGHSLGLTHNFKGSYDKANFRFNKDPNDQVEAGRQYSSIMDYFDTNGINYHKPGPYDVHALRLGYTGLVEISDALKQQIGQTGIVIPGKNVTWKATGTDGKNHSIQINNGFVRMSDLAQVLLPLKTDIQNKQYRTWWDLDGAMLAKLPLRYFWFCTDMHVGGDPTCNRWDSGTTPKEIVEHYEKDYARIYPLLNTRGNKIAMTDTGRYVSYIMRDFSIIRTFLDETFYRAINQYPDVGAFAEASVESYKFFLNVYNTPEVNTDVMDKDRFLRVDYSKGVQRIGPDKKPMFDKDGNPVIDQVPGMAVIEAKATFDTMRAGADDVEDLETRGVEIDKSLAIQMLTSRGIGNWRYEKFGLLLSFGELEKFILGMQPDQSFLMQSLHNTLADNPTPTLFVDGGIATVSPVYTPDVTSLVRYYSTMGSAIFLEANTLEEKDNFASLFRVGSTLNLGDTPSDRLVVTKLGMNPQSPGVLKFWTYDSASISANLVREAAQKRLILDNSPALIQSFAQLIFAKDPETAKTSAQATIALINSLNKNGVLISQEEANAGLTAEALVSQTVQEFSRELKVLTTVYQQLGQQGANDQQIAENAGQIMRDIQRSFSGNAKNMPLLAITGDIMVQLQAPQGLIALAKSSVMTTEGLSTNYSMIVGMLETLNSITISLHPELKN